MMHTQALHINTSTGFARSAFRRSSQTETERPREEASVRGNDRRRARNEASSTFGGRIWLSMRSSVARNLVGSSARRGGQQETERSREEASGRGNDRTRARNEASTSFGAERARRAKRAKRAQAPKSERGPERPRRLVSRSRSAVPSVARLLARSLGLFLAPVEGSRASEDPSEQTPH